MDKQALIEKIKGLDGLTNDEKSNLLGLLRSHKKYGLVWEDKPEDVEERLRDELPVLTEVEERALISDAPDAPNHILIEGDNLEALTALSYTHEGKVDVIYIDPPYNTGNKDFIYNDRFVDSEDAYRHSKWLSFMERRLRIARRLLSMGGVIFISIDDNEQAQLKLLCDDIFGAARFLGDIIRIATKRVKGDAVNINTIHDHVLCYSSSDNFVINHKKKEDFSIYELEDEHVHERGRYLIRPLDNGSISYSSKCDYIITAPDGSNIVAGGNEELRIKRINGIHNSKDWCFRWGYDKFQWGLQHDFIVFKKTKGIWRCYFKIYQYVDNNLKPTIKFDNQTSLLDECFNNQGTSELKRILSNNSIFTYPKPLSLLKTLIALHHNNQSIILDFFAGSGTTLHATMQLNAEDGGHRKCILVTNNENGICENVTYERNKRVIQGYTTPKGEEVPGLTANTLRYYKTDFISRDRTQRNMHALVEAATDLLCIKEDLYEEQTHFGRYKTHPKALRYFAQGSKRMLVIYRDEYAEEVAAEIENIELPQDEKIKIYIFSPDRYAYDDMFEDVADKVTLVALPAAIYDAYKKVLPKRREKLLELQTDNNEANEEGGEQ